tara:strand:+ start:149 stop:328 length:180 start_codon:yes stop_codon:yes gene_type:complete
MNRVLVKPISHNGHEKDHFTHPNLHYKKYRAIECIKAKSSGLDNLRYSGYTIYPTGSKQ